MSDRFPEQMLQGADNNGAVIPGAKLMFRITQTTTNKDTFSDAAKTIPNANPVVADAAGRFGDIFMDTDVAYRVTYTDANDVVIQDFDPYSPVRSNDILEIPVLSRSADFTVLLAERGSMFEIDASSGPVIVTLPPAADAGNNFPIAFKKVDSSANIVQIDADGAEVIDDGTVFLLDTQYDSATMVSNGTQWYVVSTHRPEVTTVPLPPEHITGLAISNNANDTEHDIDIAVGKCRDDTDSENIDITAALGKRIDEPWVVGGTPATTLGGMDTGVVAADTTYYMWAIKRLDTGVSDVLFSLSGTAPTMPTGYTVKRLIKAVFTDSSSNIINDQFMEVLPNGQRYTSASQVITPAGLLTLPHAMTGNPERTHCRLVCVIAEHNYTIGDEVMINNSNNGPNSGQALSIVPDATNLNIRYGNGAGAGSKPFNLIDKNTGAVAILTNANWELIVRAYV